MRETKICCKCKEVKEKSEFSKDRHQLDGLARRCKKCDKEKSSKRRKTIGGLISITYSNHKLRSRTEKNKKISYTKDEFEEWMLKNEDFNRLFKNWAKSGFKKELAPSVDRIDDYKGYSFDNIQLMTWGENSLKANKDRKEGRNNKASKAVIQLTRSGKKIKEWYSMMEAGRNGYNIGAIWSCCNKEIKTHKNCLWEYKENICVEKMEG